MPWGQGRQGDPARAQANNRVRSQLKHCVADFHPYNNKRLHAADIAVNLATGTSALVASPPIDRKQHPHSSRQNSQPSQPLEEACRRCGSPSFCLLFSSVCERSSSFSTVETFLTWCARAMINCAHGGAVSSSRASASTRMSASLGVLYSCNETRRNFCPFQATTGTSTRYASYNRCLSASRSVWAGRRAANICINHWGDSGCRSSVRCHAGTSRRLGVGTPQTRHD